MTVSTKSIAWGKKKREAKKKTYPAKLLRPHFEHLRLRFLLIRLFERLVPLPGPGQIAVVCGAFLS